MMVESKRARTDFFRAPPHRFFSSTHVVSQASFKFEGSFIASSGQFSTDATLEKVTYSHRQLTAFHPNFRRIEI
jgi:hypothetical protein